MLDKVAAGGIAAPGKGGGGGTPISGRGGGGGGGTAVCIPPTDKGGGEETIAKDGAGGSMSVPGRGGAGGISLSGNGEAGGGTVPGNNRACPEAGKDGGGSTLEPEEGDIKNGPPTPGREVHNPVVGPEMDKEGDCSLQGVLSVLKVGWENDGAALP